MEKDKKHNSPKAVGCRRLFLAACFALSLLCGLPLVLTLPELQWHFDHNIRSPIITRAPASKESDMIAFLCRWIGENLSGAVYVIHPDGSQLKQIHASPHMSFANLSWSPDANWLAVLAENHFLSPFPNERFEIFRIRFDGLDYKRLTYNRFREIAPRWSKNGRSISFIHDGILHRISDNGQEISRAYKSRIAARLARRPFDWSADDQRIIATGNYDALLYGSEPDGSDWRVLTRTGTYLAGAAWAPNAEQILYFGHGLGLEYSVLAVFNVKEQVEEFSVKMDLIRGAQWSPNGQWIAIVGRTLDDDEEDMHIFLLDVDTGVIDYVKRFDTAKLGYISWSSDSEWIAFDDYDYSLGDEDEYIDRLFKIKRDGTDLQQLVEIDCSISGVSWSPK